MCTHMYTCMWRSENNFWGDYFLFFHHMGPRFWTWVVRLGGKCHHIAYGAIMPLYEVIIITYYKLSTPYPKIWIPKCFEIQNFWKVLHFKIFQVWDFEIQNTQRKNTNITKHKKNHKAWSTFSPKHFG